MSKINDMEKFYLGISLGFNSSACIVSNIRGLIVAISQERLNGEKNTKEIPIDAMFECLKIANINKIEKIGISHYEEISNEYFIKYSNDTYKHVFKTYSWKQALCKILNNKTSNGYVPIVDVHHHVAHSYSTFAFHGTALKGDYLITSDGFGDGASGMIWENDGELISYVTLKNSIGLVYQFVTGALGFKEHQHEGKITGLAAFGKPKYLKIFESLYNKTDCGNFLDFKDDEYSLTAFETEQVLTSNIIGFDKFLKLKKAIYGLVKELLNNGATREDIAATVQEFAEKHTLKWIKAHCEPGHDCYLAGGLFANVKINQRIKDSGIFKNVYVCPAMGDEGTAIGAAICVSGWKGKIDDTLSRTRCGNVIEGDIYEYVREYLSKNNLEDKYVVIKNDYELIPMMIASFLEKNKIVCLVRDNMEFGPRALCNRSILYNCDSKDTNDWLNKKLSRTEFMPFAPVCSENFADDLFKNLDGGRNSAKLMTMTFDCTDEFIKDYPAACHIDNTARPQIISSKDDPFMHCVLSFYYTFTGKKALINTSFNLHNWPIIATKEVALESWIKSDTDCLVIEDVLIYKK